MISAYIPSVKFREDALHLINTSYVSPLLKSFFNTRNIERYYEIPQEKLIDPKDFLEVPFTYFYDVIMDDLYDDVNPLNSAAYSITYDLAHATNTCSQTGLGYQVISIGNHPVFFFIYIELQEVLAFLKKHTLAPVPSKRG